MPWVVNPPRANHMSKNICLDLDGVITDIGGQIKNYISKCDIEFDPLHIGEALLTPDGVDYLEFIFEDQLFWRNLEPIRDSWHAINEWFMSGYDITFVTARRSETSISEIEPWLESWGVMYSNVIICDMNEKHIELRKIDPLLYVDDNPNEIRCINQNMNLSTFVIKTWYNEHLIDKKIQQVNNLSNIKIGRDD